MNTDKVLPGEVEKRFLRRHWKMVMVLAVLFSGAAIGALLVLLWFVATAQAAVLVPLVLGQWSIGAVITFILHLIFWELVLVGSWVILIVAVIFAKWYRGLPVEERAGWHRRDRREEGGAFGFLVGLTWLIVIWLDGRWNLPFSSWTFNDWVYSFLAAVFWDLLIFGVPIALALVWWIGKETRREPEAAA